MPSGIRVTVEFASSSICPLVKHSETADTTISSVSANRCPGDCGESVVEFSMDADAEGDVTPIFSHGSTDRYRLSLEDRTCPCTFLAQAGCPIARYAARTGTLTLVFHTADYDQLQDVVTDLRTEFPDVDIKRFVRSPAGEPSQDTVSVNRSRLTDRQLEVLNTAREMGYFERPRKSNATEIAAELGINPSTFREHLTAAESKILDDVL